MSAMAEHPSADLTARVAVAGRTAVESINLTTVSCWPDSDPICRPAIIYRSNLGLFGHLQRVVDFDTEVSDCAFKFGVAQQQLDCSKVFRTAIDQRCFRSTHRVRAIGGVVEPDRFNPAMDDPRILAGRKVGRRVNSPREQKVRRTQQAYHEYFGDLTTSQITRCSRRSAFSEVHAFWM